jgi:hypothetical protein
MKKKATKGGYVMMENIAPDGIGYLQIRVSTAQGAIPLQDAQVVVRTPKERGDTLVALLVSDRSGLTPIVSLPTVPRSMSQSPGNPTPFYSYLIDVTKEGYYAQYYQNVPVFDGIAAVQSVEMIPLPQNGIENGISEDGERFFEGENPNL